MQQTIAVPLPVPKSARRSLWNAPFFRNRLAVLSALILLLIAVMAIAAPLVATHDPFSQSLKEGLQSPSAEHWLGTDKQGRDTWSRIVYGARPTLAGAIVVVLLSELIGVLIINCHEV